MYDEDYLAHHGIKGMKWGVRRFQNLDGTYTIAGRKRYGIGDAEKEAQRKAKAKAKAAKQKAREESKALRAKRASERRVAKAAHGDASKRLLNKLTDEELKAVNDRLKMEQSYKDMMHKIDPNSVKYFHWKEQASKIATSLLTKVTDKAIDSAVKKMFQSQDERDELELARAKRQRDLLDAQIGIRDKKKDLETGGKKEEETLKEKAERLKNEEYIYATEKKRKTENRDEHGQDAQSAPAESASTEKATARTSKSIESSLRSSHNYDVDSSPRYQDDVGSKKKLDIWFSSRDKSASAETSYGGVKYTTVAQMGSLDGKPHVFVTKVVGAKGSEPVSLTKKEKKTLIGEEYVKSHFSKGPVDMGDGEKKKK